MLSNVFRSASSSTSEWTTRSMRCASRKSSFPSFFVSNTVKQNWSASSSIFSEEAWRRLAPTRNSRKSSRPERSSSSRSNTLRSVSDDILSPNAASNSSSVRLPDPDRSASLNLCKYRMASSRFRSTSSSCILLNSIAAPLVASALLFPTNCFARFINRTSSNAKRVVVPPMASATMVCTRDAYSFGPGQSPVFSSSPTGEATGSHDILHRFTGSQSILKKSSGRDGLTAVHIGAK
mmetsp:Transcript_50124/g.150883  ORF Transcript_50124/g.150883 Transcript_50124/m.150883 type:complete len:236 (-) Transcript_50124:929-1636(-)